MQLAAVAATFFPKDGDSLNTSAVRRSTFDGSAQAGSCCLGSLETHQGPCLGSNAGTLLCISTCTLMCYRREKSAQAWSSPLTSTRVYHGCPLSVSYDIIRDGLKAGNATHQKKTGFFCIHGMGLLEGEMVFQAMKRSKSEACPEYMKARQTLGQPWPSGWSVPSVVSFCVNPRDVTLLSMVGNCEKAVIQAPVGSVIKPWEMLDLRVYVGADILNNYIKLHHLGTSSMRNDYIVCGGTNDEPLRGFTLKAYHCCGKTVQKKLARDTGWVTSLTGYWYCSDACRYESMPQSMPIL